MTVLLISSSNKKVQNIKFHIQTGIYSYISTVQRLKTSTHSLKYTQRKLCMQYHTTSILGFPFLLQNIQFQKLRTNTMIAEEKY